MDSQKCMLYGILIIVALYFLNNICGVKIPFMEGLTNDEVPVPLGQIPPPAALTRQYTAHPANSRPANSRPANSRPANSARPTPPSARPTPPSANTQPANIVPRDPVSEQLGSAAGIASCTPQRPLDPSDLLPVKQAEEISNFNKNNPSSDGILKGVNYLDAGFHVGVNTIGQSLRNANLNLREEPPNPRVVVSPWLNSTIGPDLTRKPLMCSGTGRDGCEN